MNAFLQPEVLEKEDGYWWCLTFFLHVILVCKILTDGVTGVKFRKVVYVITPHLHTKFQISTLLLCQNIPVDVDFFNVKTVKNSSYSGL